MSTLAVGVLKSNATTPPVVQNTSGVEVGQFARAWVNFNGVGVVSIRASFNVSTITDNALGWYTVNFTNAMPDANYCTVASISTPGAWSGGLNINAANTAAEVAPTTTAVSIATVQYNAGANLDAKYFNVTIFR